MSPLHRPHPVSKGSPPGQNEIALNTSSSSSTREACRLCAPAAVQPRRSTLLWHQSEGQASGTTSKQGQLQPCSSAVPGQSAEIWYNRRRSMLLGLQCCQAHRTGGERGCDAQKGGHDDLEDLLPREHVREQLAPHLRSAQLTVSGARNTACPGTPAALMRQRVLRAWCVQLLSTQKSLTLPARRGERTSPPAQSRGRLRCGAQARYVAPERATQTSSTSSGAALSTAQRREAPEA